VLDPQAEYILSDAFCRGTDDLGDDPPDLRLLSRDDLAEAIREHTDYFENLMDTMVDALVEVDPDGRVVRVNRACEEVLGYPEEAAVGKPVDHLFASGEDVSSTVSRVDLVGRLLADGQVTDMEVVFETAAGDTIPMSLSASVMRDETAPSTGWPVSPRTSASARPPRSAPRSSTHCCATTWATSSRSRGAASNWPWTTTSGRRGNPSKRLSLTSTRRPNRYAPFARSTDSAPTRT